MRSLPWAIGIVLLLVSGSAAAQDATGLWNITATFTVLPAVDSPEEVGTECEYSGTGISLTEKDGQVTGTVELDLTSGDTLTCEGGMSGSLNATRTDGKFSGTLDGSNNPGKDLGMATVSGTLSTAAGASAVAAPLNMSGSADVSSGPFSGSSGNFGGTQAPSMPSLGPLALAALALILLGGSSMLLLRRRA